VRESLAVRAILPRVTSRTDRAGLLLVFASAAAYGAMPVLGKLAYAAGVRPVSLLAWRFVLATPLLIMLTRGPRPPLRTRLILWGLGCIFAINCIAYFTALQTVPATIVALVLYTYPVLVTLLSAAFGLEPLTVRGLAAAGLAFGGTAVTAGAIPAGGAVAGLLLALTAACGYALYIVLGSRFVAGVTPEDATRHVSETCAVVFILFAAVRSELRVPASVAAWGAIAAIAVLCTVFALRMFLAGLARIGPSRAAVASACEIVVTGILAVLFIGESVGVRQWIGGALILGGVALHSLGHTSRELERSPMHE